MSILIRIARLTFTAEWESISRHMSEVGRMMGALRERRDSAFKSGGSQGLREGVAH